MKYSIKNKKSNKINKTKKNLFSWNSLQNNNCKYVNTHVSKSKHKMKKIALEEAMVWPTQDTDTIGMENNLENLITTGKGFDKYNRMLDITGKRLKEMKENNISIQVLSSIPGGLQNLVVKTKEGQVKKAIEVNDYMYNKIKDYPKSFKAFAALPMRDPKEAAIELERCVKKLGMVGALVNGTDVLYVKDKIGKEKSIMLYYDTPEYDVLWKKFEELDVPLYMHPTVFMSLNEDLPDNNLLGFYKEYPALTASAWGFHIYLAQHIMKLILSGIFDRFPKMKLILGHMGEIIPWFAERFDHRSCVHQLEAKEIDSETLKKYGVTNINFPKLTVTEYLRRNIYITTSGWFSTSALKYCIEKMGIDRIMFSIDYPYEPQKDPSDWLDNLPLTKKNKEKIAYKNAAKLLKIKV